MMARISLRSSGSRTPVPFLLEMSLMSFCESAMSLAVAGSFLAALINFLLSLRHKRRFSFLTVLSRMSLVWSYSLSSFCW